MAWSQAARDAALAARRLKAKGKRPQIAGNGRPWGGRPWGAFSAEDVAAENARIKALGDKYAAEYEAKRKAGKIGLSDAGRAALQKRIKQSMADRRNPGSIRKRLGVKMSTAKLMARNAAAPRVTSAQRALRAQTLRNARKH